jgi:hypothetical protein
MTGLPSQVVGSMTGGAASEATGQLGGGPLAQGTASLAGSVLGAGATQVVGRAISPVRATIPPERQALVDAAKGEGITLTPGEETGNPVLKNLEQAFGQLPVTSGREMARSRGTQLQFNEAMLGKGGQSGNIADPDTLKGYLSDVGGTIGTIADRNIMAVFRRSIRRCPIWAGLSGVPATPGAGQAKIDDIQG